MVRLVKERYAVKIFSDILWSYLWVVESKDDLQRLRDMGFKKEAIYIASEIKLMKGLGKEHLIDIQRVKEELKMSTVEDLVEKLGGKDGD